MLPRQALVTIYKAFIRPHLDHGDVLYDQAFNNSFHAKMESIQYNACLVISRAIRGTSTEKIYQELGLESLQLRRWYRKICLNPKGIKLITRLRRGLSHLREHKFKQSFLDTLHTLCNCGQDIESTTHFFLHCPFFNNERRTLVSTNT